MVYFLIPSLFKIFFHHVLILAKTKALLSALIETTTHQDDKHKAFENLTDERWFAVNIILRFEFDS
ncbi:Hypothetical protein LEPBI_I3059 [Leptospira biflexa serovar Patoc strain 'Patoc 1 (Paris)']|uniref:Uncharacterized protein n=1 Tax=Leptospira biflexa serovar Patoc (strain Patoc 1 / ATCC 23582 / Paris) TaxID=456481 RepID=B0SPL9_LEPBP|nr:Hypothetical protein LEPBI_I3059 [Leptospira biflexa serovar Patoc strain 'Patoc 1 (Paris)']